MWDARHPQSFHRGKLTWLSSLSWNALCFSCFALQEKPKALLCFFGSLLHDMSFNNEVDLIHILRILFFCHAEHCSDATDLINQKPLRRSSGFDFTCLTVTDVMEEYCLSQGSSSMLICSFLTLPIPLLLAGRLGWHHFASGCWGSVNWIRLVRFQGKWG